MPHDRPPAPAFTRRTLLALAAVTALPRAAAATDWPTRSVRVIVPFAAGGTTDIVARVIALALGQQLGQQLVIDNRPGAGAMLGSDLAAKAPPDGYTLVVSNIASHGISPSLYKKVPYDPVREFTHIAMLGNAPSVLVVNPAFPAKDLAGFIAYAKAHPGAVSYASSGNGSSNHLAGAVLAHDAGFEMVHVPYRGAGPALNDVIDDHLPAMLDTLTSSAAHIKAGTLRALAVAGAARAPGFPDVPTFVELGWPRMLFTSWFGLSGPAGLPADIVELLSRTTNAALASAEVERRFAEVSFVPDPMTPDRYAGLVKDEVARWAGLIREVGIAAE